MSSCAESCTLQAQLCRVLHSAGSVVQSLALCRFSCAEFCTLQVQLCRLCRVLHCTLQVQLCRVLHSSGAAVQSLEPCRCSYVVLNPAGAPVQSLALCRCTCAVSCTLQVWLCLDLLVQLCSVALSAGAAVQIIALYRCSSTVFCSFYKLHFLGDDHMQWLLNDDLFPFPMFFYYLNLVEFT